MNVVAAKKYGNVGDVVNGFERYLEDEKHFSESTLKNYGSDMKGLFEFAGIETLSSAIALKRIDGDLVESYIKQSSSKTGARKLSSLKKFFNYCVILGIYPQSPAAGIVARKGKEKEPTCITPNEFELAFESIPTETFIDLRDRSILSMSYLEGLFVREITNLRSGQIKKERKGVEDKRKERKTLRLLRMHDGVEREVKKEVTECTLAAMKAYENAIFDSLKIDLYEDPDGLYYRNKDGRQLSRRSVGRYAFPICSKAAGKKINPRFIHNGYLATLISQGLTDDEIITQGRTIPATLAKLRVVVKKSRAQWT